MLRRSVVTLAMVFVLIACIGHAQTVAIAQIYERHGAACISVLTDEPFFQGRLQDLSGIRSRVKVPLLRKDFILDRYQLLEARLAGADAVLLIAEILEKDRLPRLLREAAGSPAKNWLPGRPESVPLGWRRLRCQRPRNLRT